MTISQKGLVKEAMNQFTTDDPLPPAVVNRMQEDDALLSRGQADLFTSRNLPKIHTSDYKMVATTSADTVTLDSGVTFDVGGVIFSTDDLTSRSFIIPNDTTKYLYAAVADDCGEAVDWETDPIERKRTVSMTLEDSLVESTPTKMLILKAVKGAAGGTPVVTLYANEGTSLTGTGQRLVMLETPVFLVLAVPANTNPPVELDISAVVPAGVEVILADIALLASSASGTNASFYGANDHMSSHFIHSDNTGSHYARYTTPIWLNNDQTLKYVTDVNTVIEWITLIGYWE